MLFYLRRVLVVVLVIATTASALYLHAEEGPVAEGQRLKAHQEFKKTRKEEYLKGLEQREQYHNEMGERMRALRQACAGENREACKQAKEQEKVAREKHRALREERRERFEQKTETYRKKMGEAPTEVEKQRQRLQEEKLRGKQPSTQAE